MTSDLKRAEAALEQLGKLHPKLIDLGLDRRSGLAQQIRQPSFEVPLFSMLQARMAKAQRFVFIRSIIESSGRSIHGCNHPPHLVRFHERIVSLVI